MAAFDIGKPANVDNGWLYAERPGGGFKRTGKKSADGIVRIINHGNVGNVRSDVFEYLQHFADD